MRENMPDTHGYVDRGPRVGDRRSSYTEAGEVRALRDGGSSAWTRPAYDPKVLHALVRQGRELPRPLTLEESRLVARNREFAQETARQVDAWAVAECGMRRGISHGSSHRESRGTAAYDEGTEDRGWKLARRTRV